MISVQLIPYCGIDTFGSIQSIDMHALYYKQVFSSSHGCLCLPSAHQGKDIQNLCLVAIAQAHCLRDWGVQLQVCDKREAAL